MNFIFMAGLTSGNYKPSLWVSISAGKINLSVLLPHETRSPMVETDISKTGRSVEEKKWDQCRWSITRFLESKYSLQSRN